jgi:3-isopropylmalate/(R)-2-methylmalate dehydratase small subunit
MEPIKIIRSRTVVMPSTNIDTDQIMPARFLTTTTRAGIAKHLFADWRYDRDGQPIADFVLNQPAAVGCQILVAGRNIGCGSSREHAPWGLYDFGFRAVISSEIADIFKNNSLKNGLLPIVVDEPTLQWLIANPGAELTVDLERCTVTLPTGAVVTFSIESFARYCLLNGVDETGYLLAQTDAIAKHEARAR